eukprot:scaffold16793_cov149-Isochrysis_galbana.AAC.1
MALVCIGAPCSVYLPHHAAATHWYAAFSYRTSPAESLDSGTSERHGLVVGVQSHRRPSASMASSSDSDSANE